MAIAASLVVRISTEFGSFVRGMKQAERDLTRFGKQAKRLGRDLSTDLTLPIVAMGAVFFKAASDLERTENMFEASFGGMAASARLWSEQTSAALGLSADDTRVTMSRFNELATSMNISATSALTMSQNLTQLTLDLQAYRNIDEATASGALEAALTGRMKGLRELGIVVKEADVRDAALRNGIIRTGQTMSTAQTAVASYIVVMEAMKKTHGEMARAGDKPAVMLMKIKQQAGEVAQTMGTALMPAMQGILGMALGLAQHLKSLAEWFGKLPPWVRTATVAIAGLAAAIGPLLWALGTLILILPKLKAAAVLGFAWAANPVVLTVLAIAAAYAALAVALNSVAAANEKLKAAAGGNRNGVGSPGYQREADAVMGRLRAQWRVGAPAAGAGATPLTEEARQLAALIAEARRLMSPGTVAKGYDPKTGIGPLGAESVKRYAAETLKAELAMKALAAEEARGATVLAANAAATQRWLDGIQAAADAAEARFAALANSITDAFEGLFTDLLMGQTNAFQQFFNFIRQELARLAARRAVQEIGAFIGSAVFGDANLAGASVVGARPAALAGGDSFQINVSFAPNFIDGRSGAAWLRENEGVITEAVINGVRKSGAARQALVGR